VKYGGSDLREIVSSF